MAHVHNSRVTKAMLEEHNKLLKDDIVYLHKELEHRADIIELLKCKPESGLFMAMMSTNKLARKMVKVFLKDKK